MAWHARPQRRPPSTGLGQPQPGKFGFEVSFDRYTSGQTFLGLKSLVLDNLWQDASLFRESLGMAVFRRLGQVAPRESFARLYINNELQGVYGLTEPVDELFTTAGYRRDDRATVRVPLRHAVLRPVPGRRRGTVSALVRVRSETTDTDAMLYGPIRDLFREANAIDDPLWRERVDSLIDLPQLLTHIAIQGCLANIDGFMGYAGLNNFYLYRFAGSVRHRLFPWDEDFAFNAIDSSITRRGDAPVAFIDRAMAEPDLKAHFLDQAYRCADRMDEDGWLAAEIDRRVALVGPAILADTKKQFSNESFLADVEFLRSFAVLRPTIV